MPFDRSRDCHDWDVIERPRSRSSPNGKPHNFLQKLYQFLSLDPHPCPEIIYWAADSRQLVVAQPDRLAAEVLPQLFKHSKFASFGRQLNIYGFSRLFPGRQFQDARGNITDASVWAHPILNRLSTETEVMSVKRRAAPKLVRTRRLANGQLVRTRAGPAVEARFREVRARISETRRARQSQTPESTLVDAYKECQDQDMLYDIMEGEVSNPAPHIPHIRSPWNNQSTPFRALSTLGTQEQHKFNSDPPSLISSPVLNSGWPMVPLNNVDAGYSPSSLHGKILSYNLSDDRYHDVESPMPSLPNQWTYSPCNHSTALQEWPAVRMHPRRTPTPSQRIAEPATSLFSHSAFHQQLRQQQTQEISQIYHDRGSGMNSVSIQASSPRENCPSSNQQPPLSTIFRFDDLSSPPTIPPPSNITPSPPGTINPRLVSPSSSRWNTPCHSPTFSPSLPSFITIPATAQCQNDTLLSSQIMWPSFPSSTPSLPSQQSNMLTTQMFTDLPNLLGTQTYPPRANELRVLTDNSLAVNDSTYSPANPKFVSHETGKFTNVNASESASNPGFNNEGIVTHIPQTLW